VETIIELKRRYSGIEIIAMTGELRDESLRMAKFLGASPSL